jgi:acetaldehyde dehydrogenase
MKTQVAIIGPGNIGTDLMIKVMRTSEVLEVIALVGIDPSSDGLARAKRLGVAAIDTGVDGLIACPEFANIKIVFDATSASAHISNAAKLKETHVRVVDLTPAALGPFVVPPVNLDGLLDAPNVNMVTCGGQATIPIVAAVAAAVPVRYAEIVASISSKSAGPGTRANIDEFTESTSKAIEVVGGAEKGKAIIVLNPAEPPLIMRDTVLCMVDGVDGSGHDVEQAAIETSISDMVERVQTYVPGYRLKQSVQFRTVAPGDPENDLVAHLHRAQRLIVSVFLEVEGAGHYLPPYAGNLDIMTSAALRVGERFAANATVSA